MKRYIEELIEGIRAGDAKAFLGAGEVARAHVLGLEGTLEPYASLYAAEPIADADAVALKSALVEHLVRQDAPHAATAAFALGKFQDGTLVPLLRDCLASHLRLLLTENAVVGQLICALENHGEGLMTEGFTITGTETSIADARRYLGRFGLTFPW